MKFGKQLLLLLALGLLINTPVLGAEVQIIAPYFGTEENTYTDDTYGLDLRDSGPMKGLYFQTIDTEKYQWNLFLYQTTDINYSEIQGANLIFDYYFGADPDHKKVIGIGANYFKLDLAGEDVPTKVGVLDAFQVDLTIVSPYLRVGQYFTYDHGQTQCTILPWVGGQWDLSRGDGSVDPPGPWPPTIAFEVDDNQFSWIAGVNLRVQFSHFLQLEAKQAVTYTDGEYFSKSTALVNLFMTRNLGLTYRFNYHETTMGTDSYNLLGLAVVF